MRVINEIKLVSDNGKSIISNGDYGFFELKEREDGTKYYDGGYFSLPYATNSIYLAKSIVNTYNNYFYEVDDNYYNSEEFKIYCLNKFLENQN